MSCEIVDLSHPIDDTMPVYPGDIVPEVKPVATIDKQGYRESKLILSTHSGTHIDSPSHILVDGASLDSFQPDNYIGHGEVLDCRRESRITLESLKVIKSSKLPDFVLIYTGWDRYWGKPAYFSNFPVLDPDASDYFARLPLKGIGIDAPSFDPAGSGILYNHKTLLSMNILLIENLTGLQNLLNKKFIFSCFPLNIKNADGSPVRASASILN